MFTSLAVLISVLAPSVPVHVEGDGYLRFVRDGRTVYAKQAVLTVVGEALASAEGPVVSPRVQVSGSPTSITVSTDGRVSAVYAGASQEVGRLVLAVFPEDVRPVVEKGFLVSSYRPSVIAPGEKGAGTVVSTGSTAAPIAVARPTATGVVEIVLRDSAQVEGSTFTLGDIADVSADDATKSRLSALEVSTTPALGVSYKMSPAMVRQRLMRYGKEADQYKFSGSNQVTVTRKGQDVTHAMVVEAALTSARKQMGEDAQLVADVVGPTVVAPVGKLELVAENVTVSGIQVSVRIAIVVDGQRFNSRTVSLKKDDAISKMRAGQTVKVIARSSAATVETTGRVRSVDLVSGTVVVTTATGAELIGRPISHDTVEVQL
ncbi:MAG: hypothetical protein WD716_02645 [Fimbriimonadaceae bacterium]